MELIRVELDGREPTLDELYGPLLANFGHFTALQVRAGRARGLDLHLTRLSAQTRELLGADLDTGQVRGWLRHALRDVPDASVRVNVYPGPTVMIFVRPPASPPASPLRLRSVPYERPAAHLKHVGGFGQIYFGLRAEAEGFDDALLTDRTGAVCESAIANIAFFDGTTVTWPTGPHLPGIEMQLLEPRLPSRRARVDLGGLGAFRSAFTTNSIGVTAVARIDDVEFTVDAGLMHRVEREFTAVPWDSI
ncbi:aminotransferase class IV [Dactylosporangium vinaceum]|uniref:Aminotransferase class IV n=1 Tax=Dactylosporangium vinaceum TaxID=53362 RepID=A0ABV5MR57_9ACTN|nr:aminotransferase class IV [Dactylosporangium vinaceum]